MKRTISLCVVWLVLSCSAVFGQEVAAPTLRVRPIQMVSIAPLPAGLPQSMLPHGSYAFRGVLTSSGASTSAKPALDDFAGFEVTYLIEGQNIVHFETLEIDEIKTPDGVSVAKDPSSDYQGGFPQTSPDGKFCVFSLRVRGNQFGKVERLTIKGEASLLVASKLEEVKVDLVPDDKRELKVGPYLVKIKSGEGGLPLQVFAPLEPATPPPTAPAAESGVTTTVPEDLINLEITGPLKTFISAEFIDGKTRLQPSSSWNDAQRVYSMLLPKSGKITTTIRYATDVKTVRVPIGE